MNDHAGSRSENGARQFEQPDEVGRRHRLLGVHEPRRRHAARRLELNVGTFPSSDTFDTAFHIFGTGKLDLVSQVGT